MSAPSVMAICEPIGVPEGDIALAILGTKLAFTGIMMQLPLIERNDDGIREWVIKVAAENGMPEEAAAAFFEARLKGRADLPLYNCED